MNFSINTQYFTTLHKTNYKKYCSLKNLKNNQYLVKNLYILRYFSKN